MTVNEEIFIACKLALDRIQAGKLAEAKAFIQALSSRHGVASVAASIEVHRVLTSHKSIAHTSGGTSGQDS